MMATYMNCSLVNLLLLLTMCTCLALPTWIEVDDHERMMSENNGRFNDVGTARDEFKDKIPFRLSDTNKIAKKPTGCCDLANCYCE